MTSNKCNRCGVEMYGGEQYCAACSAYLASIPPVNQQPPQNPYQPQYNPYQQPPPTVYYAAPPAEPGASDALVAMILGIASIATSIFPLAIVSLVFASKSNQKQESMGRERLSQARVGKITSIISLILIGGGTILYVLLMIFVIVMERI
ncbi:MAG: hypothetical protein FWG45_03690 [Oscillospiraceae bacterium]|nr:hypothetical protein [Oscillospiraceae bacterium]